VYSGKGKSERKGGAWSRKKKNREKSNGSGLVDQKLCHRMKDSKGGKWWGLDAPGEVSEEGGGRVKLHAVVRGRK